MATAVGKYAANKMLGKQMKKYQGKAVEGGDDPYFALIEDPKRPGKMKKVKKTIPSYIPAHDAMVLASVRKTAYRLDMCLFSFLGIRFGWEALIGLIPGIGDLIGLLFALSVFRKAQTVEGGLDSSVRTRMAINIALDFGMGLVPILGDLVDAAFKCNTKNARLLEVYLDQKYRPVAGGERAARGGGEDREKRRQNRKSGIYHRQDPPPATVFEDFSDEEDERGHVGGRDQQGARAQRPQETRAPPEGRKAGRGWFGGGSKRQPDEEQQTGSVRR